MKKACSKLLNPRPNPLFPRFGFTLIELLIAVSIITILFTIGTAQYMKFNRQQILEQAILELKTNLTQARNMALAGKKDCEGVFDGILVEFDGDEESYSVYSSCANKTAKSEPIGGVRRFTQGVEIKNAPDEILFKTLIGGTDLEEEQTVTLSLSGTDAELTITPSGKIEGVP